MSLLVGPARIEPPAVPAETCWVETSSLHPGTVLIRISGEIDLGTTDLVDDALRTALHHRPAHLLVDLADTRFCGLRGLALLVAAHATATGLGVGFAVCGASAQTVRLWALLWEPAERPALHPDVPTGCAAASPSNPSQSNPSPSNPSASEPSSPRRTVA